MLSKKISKRISALVILTGLVFSSILTLYFISKNKIESNQAIIVRQEQNSLGLPVRLKIPNINVNSAVESVGLTPLGEMDTPKDITNVAWFNLGVYPGEIGSSVIDGHYGWKNGKASAFDNLYKLHAGDKLYVENDRGVSVSFVVREIKSYDYKSDAKDIFSSHDGKSHLNLITCGGVWDKTVKSYSTRLVIFADRVD